MTFNVRGFKNFVKQQEIMNLVRSLGVDVLFLQETNFRTRHDIMIFRTRFSVEAFFSLTQTQSRSTCVVFLNPSFRRGAHCLFDAEGLVIAADMWINDQKIRFTNFYAPVDRSLANDFFRGARSFLLNSAPCVLLRDFNCVFDSIRDVRGPSQGQSTYHLKELQKICGKLKLVDAWTTLHGNTFGATRVQGTSQSRIDRVYIPNELVENLDM